MRTSAVQETTNFQNVHESELLLDREERCSASTYNSAQGFVGMRKPGLRITVYSNDVPIEGVCSSCLRPYSALALLQQRPPTEPP
jgi:hypothetical protein